MNFVAGGISTPADAALVMQLGAEGVFVGSGIFKSEDPARMANAIVQATTFFDDAKKIAEVSKGSAPDARHRPRGDPGAGAASPSAAGKAAIGPLVLRSFLAAASPRSSERMNQYGVHPVREDRCPGAARRLS